MTKGSAAKAGPVPLFWRRVVVLMGPWSDNFCLQLDLSLTSVKLTNIPAKVKNPNLRFVSKNPARLPPGRLAGVRHTEAHLNKEIIYGKALTTKGKHGN